MTKTTIHSVVRWRPEQVLQGIYEEMYGAAHWRRLRARIVGWLALLLCMAASTAMGATVPTIGCSSTGFIFNTAYSGNPSGPALASGSRDTYWQVNSSARDTASPYTVNESQWVDAYVVGQRADWAASPFNNADWIAHNNTGSSPSAYQRYTYWYRYQFNLDSNIDPSAFFMKLSFYADDSLGAVYVNGVAQSSASIPDNIDGDSYSAGNGATLVLDNSWKVGLNEIRVRIADRGGWSGFLVQYDTQSSTICTTRTTINAVSNGGTSTFGYTGTNGVASQSVSTLSAGVAAAGAQQTLTAVNATTTITQSSTPPGFRLNGIACTGQDSGATMAYNTTASTNGAGVPGKSVRFSFAGNGRALLCTFTNQAVVDGGAYWDGMGAANNNNVTGGAGTWNATNTNWTDANGAQNGAWAANGVATFTGTGGAVTTTAPQVVGGLVFRGNGYTLSGSTLTGGLAMNVLTTDSGVTAVVGNALAGANAFQKTGAGTLRLTGPNTYSGATTISGGTLQVGGTGALGWNGSAGAYSSAITNNGTLQYSSSADQTLSGGITGTGALIKDTGTGTLTLRGTGNNYSGNTTVSAGTLALTGPYGTTSFAISAGAVLEFNNSSGSTFDLSTATFSGAGTLRKTGSGQIYWGAGKATFALSAGSLIDVQLGLLNGGANDNDVWTNNKSGLNVAVAGLFATSESAVIVDALTGSGIVLSAYGTAYYPNAGLTVGIANGSGTFDGKIVDSAGVTSAAKSLIKAGTGTQTLTGANTYTGATAISGGTLQIGGSGTLGWNGTSGAYAAGITNNATLRYSSSANQTLSGAIAGTGALVKDTGAGTLTLSSASNTYTGTTTVSAGTLALGANNALPAGSAVTVNSGGTLNLGTYSQTLSNGLTVAAGGSLNMGSSGALTLSGGTSNVSSIAGTGTITVGPGATLNLKAGINAGNVNIVMAGGTLHLGTFAHSFGTLTQTAASTIDFNFGSGSSLTVATLGSLGSGLTLTANGWTTGNNHFYASAVTGSPARNTLGLAPLNQVKLGSNGAASTYWASGTPGELLAGALTGSVGYTFWDTVPGNGVIDGGTGTWDGSQVMWTNSTGASNSTWVAGSIATFQGTAGTVTVSGTQYITGLNFNVDGYVVTGGTLSLNANSAITVAGAATATIATPISGVYGMTFAGGTTIINGTTLATGDITVQTGTLQVGNGGTTGDIASVNKVALSNGTSLIFNRSDTYTFNKQIANTAVGVGTVVQNGSGTTVLGYAPNGWAAATLVNNGTLRYGVAGAIPTATPVTVAAGATLDVNGLSVSRSGTTTVNGTLALGSGGSVNFTGGSHSVATISGSGTITVGAGASLTLTGNITNSGVNIVLAGGSLNLAGGTTSSLGNLSQSAASTLDLSGSGNASLRVSNLNPNGFALAVNNWTNGADHLYATAVTGTPTRNTVNITPLNQISLGGNAASRTYWASGTDELLLGAAASYTYWDTTAGNNSVDGGTGNWDATNGNWSDNLGNFNGTWAAGSVANFQGSAGTVTVTANQSIGGLVFSTSGYTLGGSNSLNLASASNTITVSGSGGIATINAPLTGSAGNALVIAGAGTTVLGGANTYAGSTSVASGATLRVNGSTASASAVSVASGATLGGSGTVAGTTSVSGTLSPGASAGVAGTLTTGALSLASGASVALDLGASGTTGGGVNDLVQVNGNLDLGGASLSINPLSGFSPTGSYVLMSYTGTRTGTFASNNLGVIGYLGLIQYDDTNKQVKLISIPRVRIAQISNGGIGTFNFVLSGLDSVSAQLTTSVAGTAVTSGAYSGSIGTAVTLTQTSPLGWPATPASISCVDASGASNGNGTGALGSVAGSAVSLTGGQMRAGADITCTFTNTNNGITGVVFNDNGAPSAGVNTATANDGIRGASEQGISGVTVSLTNCAGTTYASTTTDGAGAYSLAVPTAQNGQNVCVVLTPASGYIATGANVAGSVLANAGSTSVAGVAYGYTRSSRQVSFTAAASGQAAINFGEVPVSTLTPATSARSVAAGVNAVHAHTFTAGTGGSLSLSLGAGTANPASVSGWSEIAYLDSGCTGTVQPNATRLYPSGSAQTVTAGQVVCFVVQESVPAAAANGNSHAVPVTATLSFTNAAPALSASYSATDTTTVSSSALQLTKAVRNVTQGGSFGTNNQAKPGEVLEYRISYENTTASPMSTLVINDSTPAYTSFVSAEAGTTPTQLGTCTKVTPANVAPAPPVECATVQATTGAGAVSWSFTGSLPGGAAGEVLMRVKVE